ncbi:MAG: sulfate reduction electron transfer complex DsrMKJOP subunit DsrM [Caldimicrobium sp.]|nr:sulfate reduction electron transfer complex DsrMKJOP subunit DsrM [Caldimicrobium sp.]MCX7612673.1 sulfate reduction electron transfer complex DsrMKJOP subunit DsrM [Caldimicrobium sp.]MDW8182174.1 sulfate reduction electron transfer complex DsrMKJOP subunit DsrM [Caldimicrobium sp.]
MNSRYNDFFFSLLIIAALILIPMIGVGVLGLKFLFGVIIPYGALAVFIIGLIYRMVNWARSPQPFKIPTTCGQQKSLPWIKRSRLESPASTFEVGLRMFFEVFLFRSLFRNLRADLEGKKLIYGSAKFLWLGAMLFHLGFLIIILRHLRFFVYPVPEFVNILEKVDGFFQISFPTLYLSDLLILLGLSFLLLRRLFDAKVNYISYASDYFPLLLIISIVITGILMRVIIKPDIFAIKHYAIKLATFKPIIPEAPLGVLFYVHLFLVSSLAMYFPFSKLVHMIGVFFSPTRNMANDNRMKRHVNPWDYPVKYTTYAEWQEKFRDVMEEAGMPIDEEWVKEAQKQT